MTKQITTYTANTTGISTGNVISSASEITARTNSAAAINNNSEVLTECRERLEGVYKNDCVINVDSTKFTSGTNTLDILADAIIYWDQSVYDADKTADASISGWGSKTLSSLAASSTYYIWATFVSGVKDYEATLSTSALPSNLSEKVLIGIATVNGSNAVSFTANWMSPEQTGNKYFRDNVNLLGNLEVKGIVNLLGNLEVKGIVTPYSIKTSTPYTVLTSDNTLVWNGSANGTFNLYTANGNAGRSLEILNTTSLYLLTLDGFSAETIDGSTTLIVYPGQTVKIKCDGTGWRSIKEQGKGEVLIQEQIVSSPVSAVDFTTGLNSTYKYYKFYWDRAKPATDQVQLTMRFSTNGGSSYDAGASDYSYTASLPNAVTTSSNNSSISFNFHPVTAGLVGNAAGEQTSGFIYLFNVSDSTTRTTYWALSTWLDSNSSCQGGFVSGGRNAVQDTDAVRFLFSSGNIVSGTFRLYGIN